MTKTFVADNHFNQILEMGVGVKLQNLLTFRKVSTIMKFCEQIEV